MLTRFSQLVLSLFLIAPKLHANVIQLAYLKIETSDNKTYQILWKQPSNVARSSTPLSIAFESSLSLQEKTNYQVNGWRIKTYELIAKNGLSGKTLTIKNLEKTVTDVIVKYQQQSLRLTPDQPSYTFTITPSSWQTIQSYTMFGVEHILEGYDHLLFVLCLLIIASNLKKLLWAITGFTLAHSITLIISTLEIIRIPIVPVEACIALSIVFLAVEIAKHNKKSISYRYPVSVSSSFGLLHGFGFASALLELGLPQNDRLLALGFFNVGVEIGQLLFIGFVLLALKSLKLGSMHGSYRLFNSYVIGSIASMWLIERIIQF